MAEPVYIIGSGRTDFKRNLRKEGKTIRHLILESARAAIADSKIDPGEVQAGIVGNFAGGLFTRQLHLGAFLTEVDVKLRGIPTMHVEAACASGSLAVLNGAQKIMGGLHDVVLVVGAEQQKTLSPLEGSDVLSAAADYEAEKPDFGDYMFPKLFGRIAQIYMERYGLTEEQLARISVKNYAHARLNPLAQMRDRELTLKQASTESEDNRRIAPPLKITDCSQITDGSAAVVLCSGKFLEKIGAKAPHVRLLGYGHTTDYLPLKQKDAPTFTIATRAADQAYEMARLKPQDIHGAEVHDCFSISELVAYEILGLAGRGKGADFLETGATALPSVRHLISDKKQVEHSVPVNTGGGLIGDGHPVGATGVRQVHDAFRQLSSRAANSQIEGAKKFLTFNMGGSLTTSVAMIWGRE
jgi:acetyl-CoA C-acetyltransferase